MKQVLIWGLSLLSVVGIGLSGSENGLEELKAKERLLWFLENDAISLALGANSLMIPLTLIQGAASKGADFYNWNRVKLCYCDEASFAGEGQNETHQLYFRGQRIWSAAMEELMAKGIKNAEQGVQKNLPITCTIQMDPTSCLFPQNLVANIKTPMFLLNAAYDAWQVQEILIPSSADPHGLWRDCKMDQSYCS